MQQWRSYAQGYRERAGSHVAERFISAVEGALKFIRESPFACPIYHVWEGYEDLQSYQFRKWNLTHFPHMVLFRMGDHATIFVEVMYAHKMDIPSRLATDLEKP